MKRNVLMFLMLNIFMFQNIDISYTFRKKHKLFSVGSVAIFLNDISMDVALSPRWFV